MTRVRRMLKRVAVATLIRIVVLPNVAGPLGLGAAPLPSAGHLMLLPGGYRVNVLGDGSGPAVLLIHGLPGSASLRGS